MTARLAPRAFETLVHVIASWPRESFVVIGATSILAHGVRLPRSTNDVDVVIALAAEHLPELRERLTPTGWETRPREPHKFRHHRASLTLDVIPAARSPERIQLARGLDIDLRGCEVALRHAMSVDVADAGSGATLTIPVPPLPAIALLKLIAFDDNPQLREKDIDDVVTIAQHMLPDDDLARWESPLRSIRRHELQCFGALGASMRPYASPDYLDIPERVLSRRDARARLEAAFAGRPRGLGGFDDFEEDEPVGDAEAITAALLLGLYHDETAAPDHG